jgi:hypothetical protein
MPQGISSYIKSFYRINYLKHCISYTSVHTIDIDFTQQDGVVNKQLCYTELCSMLCVCVPKTEHGNNVLEEVLMENSFKITNRTH